MKHFYSPSILPAALAIAFFSGLVPASHAQGGDPHAIIEKGLKATGLTGADAPAWHIKANYTLYDLKGATTESGTFEEWYTGPWTWHRSYTEKKLSANEWSVSHGKAFKLKDNKLDVSRLDRMVALPLTNPLHETDNFKGDIQLEGVAGTFSGLILDCVSVSDASRAASKINPDLLYPRMCFDVNDSTLRFTTTSDTLTAFTDFKPFGSRQVANKIEVKPFNKLGTALDITLLEPLPAADQAQIAPPGNAQPLPWAHQPGDAPLVPVRVTECAYPMEARNAQEHGVVSIPVIIKKDGSVKNNGPAQGPQHLTQAGEECVTNYKFEPFKLDGEAVDTSDVLVYNFDNKAFKGTIGIASQPAPPTPPAAK